MGSRFAAIGLLAGLFMSVAGLAEEASPSPAAAQTAAEGAATPAATPETTATAESSSAGESAAKSEAAVEPEAVAESAQPAAEAGVSTAAGADGTSTSAAEAAAAAVDIQTEKTKAFDPNKAKPSEIAAYNATAEPDDRILCKRDRESAATGARFSQKLCRSVRQWRELGR